jgi:hypothetical protein
MLLAYHAITACSLFSGVGPAGVGRAVLVEVGVEVGVRVLVGVRVSVGVRVTVGVLVTVGVFVGVRVTVGVLVMVGVFVGTAAAAAGRMTVLTIAAIVANLIAPFIEQGLHLCGASLVMPNSSPFFRLGKRCVNHAGFAEMRFHS